MGDYKLGKVKVIAEEYSLQIDDGDKLKNLKLDPGYKLLEKFLSDRKNEAVDVSVIDSTLSPEEVKMQVVLQIWKVELIDAIFAFIEGTISNANNLSQELDSEGAEVVPDDKIIKPRQ